MDKHHKFISNIFFKEETFGFLVKGISFVAGTSLILSSLAGIRTIDERHDPLKNSSDSILYQIEVFLGGVGLGFILQDIVNIFENHKFIELAYAVILLIMLLIIGIMIIPAVSQRFSRNYSSRTALVYGTGAVISFIVGGGISILTRHFQDFHLVIILLSALFVSLLAVAASIIQWQLKIRMGKGVIGNNETILSIVSAVSAFFTIMAIFIVLFSISKQHHTKTLR